MKPGFEKAQVVVLSNIDWTAAWQRHQIFASALAADGHDVFFVENPGIRAPGLRDLGRVLGRLRSLAAPRRTGLPQNLRVISPLVLPPTGRTSRLCNAELLVPRLIASLRAAGLGPRPLVIVYLPTATTREILRRLEPGAVAYDCAANFRAHPEAPADLPAHEAALLSRANLVVCDSDFLYQQKRSEHGHVVQIHQGVPEGFFAAKPPDPRLRRLAYYGTWGKDLDPAFLDALCAAGFEVTVSGFLKGSPAPLPRGVRHLPAVPPKELVARLETFDAFLMPYRRDPFLQGVVPAKLYECLAMGRPVLATPLPCFAPLGRLIHISDDPREWVKIARGLPSSETPSRREARVALAREHSQGRELQRLRDALRGAWEK